MGPLRLGIVPIFLKHVSAILLNIGLKHFGLESINPSWERSRGHVVRIRIAHPISNHDTFSGIHVIGRLSTREILQRGWKREVRWLCLGLHTCVVGDRKCRQAGVLAGRVHALGEEDKPSGVSKDSMDLPRGVVRAVVALCHVNEKPTPPFHLGKKGDYPIPSSLNRIYSGTSGRTTNSFPLQGWKSRGCDTQGRGLRAWFLFPIRHAGM